MSYRDMRCNDSHCQESREGSWHCTRCHSLNCRHAVIWCWDCDSFRLLTDAEYLELDRWKKEFEERRKKWNTSKEK